MSLWNKISDLKWEWINFFILEFSHAMHVSSLSRKQPVLKTEQPVELTVLCEKDCLSWIWPNRVNLLINISKSIGQPVWNWTKQSRCSCQILKLILRSNHQQIYKNLSRSNLIQKILSGQKGRKILMSSDNSYRH